MLGVRGEVGGQGGGGGCGECGVKVSAYFLKIMHFACCYNKLELGYFSPVAMIVS